jgi:hypothetical protein
MADSAGSSAAGRLSSEGWGQCICRAPEPASLLSTASSLTLSAGSLSVLLRTCRRNQLHDERDVSASTGGCKVAANRRGQALLTICPAMLLGYRTDEERFTACSKTARWHQELLYTDALELLTWTVGDQR